MNENFTVCQVNKNAYMPNIDGHRDMIIRQRFVWFMAAAIGRSSPNGRVFGPESSLCLLFKWRLELFGPPHCWTTCRPDPLSRARNAG
jgi:hypothetical protein